MIVAGRRSPLAHQAYGLQWAKSLDYIGLFWEMRLGKTLVAIRWSEHKTDGCVLVIAPLAAHQGWIEELEQEGYYKNDVQIIRSRYDVLRKVRWTLATPDAVRNNVDLRFREWNCIIFDESDLIRNPRALITKLVLKHFSKVPYRMLLSGTPAPESPLEYVTQAMFLKGDLLGYKSYWEFRSRECHLAGFDWRINAGTLPRMLQQLWQFCYPLTRRQAGMGAVNVREVRTVEMPVALRKVYTDAEKAFVLGDEETKHVSAVRTWLARLAGGCHPMFPSDHKLQELKRLLSHELDKEPVVIWCSYVSECKAVADLLHIAAITGTVSSRKRASLLWNFKSQKDRYLVAQNQTLQYGVDLSVSSTQVFFSLPWNLKSWKQCQDRIQHPTKTEPVLTLALITKDSVDEDVRNALNDKSASSEGLLSLIHKNFVRRTCKN